MTRDCRKCLGTGNSDAYLDTVDGIARPVARTYHECTMCAGSGVSGARRFILSPAAQLLVARLLENASKELRESPAARELRIDWTESEAA